MREPDPLACPSGACDFVGATTADLTDHLIIRRYTDPTIHPDPTDQYHPEGSTNTP